MKKVLPAPFKPISVNGYGIGGICLIRLKNIRPNFFPQYFGVSSENAAHRFAVYWYDEKGIKHEGVYIPRRDTSLFLNSLVGGRVFPGIHHYSKFRTKEESGNYEVSFNCPNDGTYLSINANETQTFPSSSIFKNLEHVSTFFRKGAIGYSPNKKLRKFEGLELITNKWEVSNLKVNEVTTSFLNDGLLFPNGSVSFDNALLMKNITHTWKSHSDLQYRL
ncbi:hypothetical protein [Halobacteriovorax sp. HFRX-1_3]